MTNYQTEEYQAQRELEETIRQSERSLVQYRAEVDATKKLSFQPRIEAINKAKVDHQERMATWIMDRLNYERHDSRNRKVFVRKCLVTYYSQCMNGIVTPSGWDERFSHWTPYNGTY